jgi:hypothetical protein
MITASFVALRCVALFAEVVFVLFWGRGGVSG